MRSVCIAVLTACALPLVTGTASAATSGDWVGRAGKSDVFVALSVARDGTVVAYVCDGKKGRRARNWGWFTGRLSGKRFDLRSKRIRLAGRIGQSSAKGAVTLASGRKLRFDAGRARGRAGLYRFNGTVRGVNVKAGWILLNNGQARGFTSDNPTLRNACNDMFLQVKRFFVKLEAGTATIQDADRAEELQNIIDVACY